jgi:hypothetical protein
MKARATVTARKASFCMCEAAGESGISPLSRLSEDVKKMKATIYPKSWNKALAENTREIIRVMRELFVQRDDVYGVQVRRGKSCVYRLVKEPLTDEVIKRHLRGEVTIATYPARSSTTKWVCVDIDSRDKNKVKEVLATMKKHGIRPVLEDSGGKGFHGCVFFEKGIPNWKARAIGEPVACGNEIFPKQDLLQNGSYGSLLKLPLGVHRETGRWCCFLNEEFQQVDDQLLYLKQIMTTRQDGEALWRKVAASGMETERRRGRVSVKMNQHVDIAMMKPCVNALIGRGAERGWRNTACDVVVCECRRAGMSAGQARAVVGAFNRRNRPPLPRGELHAIVTSAYTKSYQYGCRDDGALMGIVSCIGKKNCPFYRRLIEKKR